MPYIIDKNEIRTKLFGVSLKIADIGRQQLLTIMRNNPETIENVFVFGTTCYITYGKKDYVLGYIKENYSSLLNSHDCKVIRWKVTGGYDIVDEGKVKEDVSNMGINIFIQLSSITKNVIIF